MMTNKLGKRIVILGAGESGTGAALLAKAKGFEVFVSDISPIAEKYKSILNNELIAFEEGKHSKEAILNADEVIKSPGIPGNVEIVRMVNAQNIPVVSEIEFAYRYTKAKFIIITGTNGKTTTTLLTYHLLKKAGLKVGLAGNIGDSLAKQVIEDTFEYYVLEISSFQLDGMYKFKADVAILLNITPDHLDRYSYDMQQYINSKFRVLQNMTTADQFIYYSDQKTIADEIEKRSISPSHLPISLTKKLQTGAFLKDGILTFLTPHLEKMLPVSEVNLKGDHNMINTMAAVLAALSVGVHWKNITEGLKDFKNAPHRLEYVAEIRGVKFINDSKATNVDAVSYALGSFEEPLVWIAGGTDKGNDYSALYDLAKKHVKALVCLGADNKKIKGAFKDVIINIKESKQVDEAVKTAFKLARPGDSVLLSPACASFDLFKNYEDRGNSFKNAVLKLKTELEK